MVSTTKLMQTAARAQSGLLSDKKGQLGNPLKIFIGIAIALVIVVFVIVMGIVMTENLSDQVNDSAAAQAAADQGTTELSGLLGWVTLVILVMVMVVLIGAILLIGNIA